VRRFRATNLYRSAVRTEHHGQDHWRRLFRIPSRRSWAAVRFAVEIRHAGVCRTLYRLHGSTTADTPPRHSSSRRSQGCRREQAHRYWPGQATSAAWSTAAAIPSFWQRLAAQHLPLVLSPDDVWLSCSGPRHS
jgi:hypothetical protein